MPPPPPGFSPSVVGSRQANQLLAPQSEDTSGLPTGHQGWTPPSQLPVQGYQSPELQNMIKLLQGGV